MRERELLESIYTRSSGLSALAGVLVGPGDDAAVLQRPTHPVVATVDQLIEGRHFEPGTPPELIARKAVGRSISDAAAMAATPWAALATVAIPPHFHEADALSAHLDRWARAWGAPLVGGDLAATTGPLTLTVTVLAQPSTPRGPVLRSQAQSGDAVYTTGRLGASLPTGRHLHVVPRFAEAIWLARALGPRLGAMIDISDGLGLDAARIARASGLSITLDADRLPLDPVATWREALADGEDYELLFTARGPVPRIVPGLGTPITRIGLVEPGEGCRVRTPTGDLLDASDMGFEHRDA